MKLKSSVVFVILFLAIEANISHRNIIILRSQLQFRVRQINWSKLFGKCTLTIALKLR